MLKGLFKYLGVYQNTERLKAEVEFEVAAHRVVLQRRLRIFAVSASLAAVAGVLLLIGVLFASFAVYEFLADYIGRAGSLTVVASIYVLAAVILFALSASRAKLAPPARPLILPKLFVASPEPVPEGVATRANYNSTSTHDPVLSWMKSRVVGSLPAQLDEPIVRSFIDAVTPQTEAAARNLFDKSLNTLRHGNRKSVFGVLIAGVISGYIISRQSKHL